MVFDPSIITINMCQMFIKLCNYIMIIIVMGMPCYIVRYIMCMLYVLCELVSTINKTCLFMLAYIDVIIT